MKKRIKGSRKGSDPDYVSSSGVNSIKDTFSGLFDAKILKFVGSYIFYIGLFTLLYIIFKDDLGFVKYFTASIFSATLNIIGIENTLNSNVVYLSTISLKVIDECTGMYEVLVYAGCVMAYSTTYIKKLYGIAFGIPAIFGINMVRLVCLAFVGIWMPDIFDYVHYYLWQVTLILIIVLIMLIWIEKVVKK